MQLETILALLIGSSVLSLLAYKKKRALETATNRRNGSEITTTKTTSFYLLENSLEFLVPLSLVLLFYLVVLLIVTPSDNTNLQKLLSLEKTLSRVQSSLSLLKLSPIGVLGVLIAIYALGLLRIPGTTLIRSSFAKYRVYIRRLYTLAVLLTSFTLFGAHVGNPDRVALHIKTIRLGYADLQREVVETLSEQASHKILEKALASFPQAYIDALNSQRDLAQQLTDLGADYKTAQAKYNIRSKRIEDLIRGSEQGAARPSEVTIPGVIPDGFDSLTEEERESLTPGRISELKRAVASYRAKLNLEKLPFDTEDGKAIILHIPNILTAELRDMFLVHVKQQFPIVGPVVDVLSRTVEKVAKAKMEDLLYGTTNKAIDAPNNVAEVLNKHAGALSEKLDEIRIDVPKEARLAAISATKQIQDRAAVLESARTQLSELKPKVVVYFFFAPQGCEHCEGQAPEMEALNRSHMEGVEVIGIPIPEMGGNDKSVVDAFVRGRALTFRIESGSALLTETDISQHPVIKIVNKKTGISQIASIGETSENELRQQIEAFMRGEKIETSQSGGT